MNTGEAGAVWEQAYKLLLKREETKSYLARGYLDYLVPFSLDEKKLVFSVRLLHAKIQIEKRYLSFIREAVSSAVGSPRDIVLIVDETLESPLASTGPLLTPSSSSLSSGQTSQQVLSSSRPTPQADSFVSPQHAQSTQQFALVSAPSQPPLISQHDIALSPSLSGAHSEGASLGTGISTIFAPDTQTQSSLVVEPDSRFTFSNYLMGDSNNFAAKASMGVAEAPGQYINPLFIYGKSGLGKTHLMMAIKNSITTYLPNKRVIYAPTTEMVTDFTDAFRGVSDVENFKQKYTTCDVLLLDDVQYLEGKEETTNALFEIFNMFIREKKQIVLSADRHPAEINIDERFTSRFNMGVSVDIQPPNHELKMAILKNYKRYYCGYLGIAEVEFSDEAMQRIVELSGSNIRELEGAVSSLIFSASCRPENQKLLPISHDDVEKTLGSSFFHKNTNRIDISSVMRAVESYFKISRDELVSEKRSKNISHPRQVAMYLLRRYTDMSYPEIGDSFNKDHTTVMYADRNIQDKMVKEDNIKTEISRIVDILTA